MKQRSSNLELYRIICMFLIVCHHYVVNSGLNMSLHENPLADNSLFYYLFGMWGKTGINCFILITGYFMCFKGISLQKYLKLYFWILFYRIIFTCVFIATGYSSFSLRVLWNFLPIRNIHSDSFTNAFMVWYLFIPFLSALVSNLSQKMHRNLVLLSTAICVFWPFLPTFNFSVNPISWFSTLFFIASYIRKYPDCIIRSSSARFWGVVSLFFVLMAMASVVCTLYYNVEFGKDLPPYYFVSDSNAPLALCVSVTSFMFFKNINLKYNRLINIGGATSFGVLLIHANSASMRTWLWKDTIDCVGHYNSFLYPLYAFGCCCAIYLICSFIDYLRQRWIEPLYMHALDAIIDKRDKQRM